MPTIKLIFPEVFLAIVMFMMLGTTVAVADETSEPGSGTTPGVIVKAEKAIKRGAKAVAHGVERGANAAARGIKHGAEATARGVERGATATSNAAHAVARKVDGSPDQSSSSDK